ncbi:phosphotransferase [Nocardia mexicana]|uniref:Phosphotransferase family enzyme n=1 Tax=Nocardia mexicana TaxID=279262 RepID=A0A370H8D4_9NOCA|nr:phosphotransferase [Nocardia mexicana]RDI52927.1 phosphotransferase family enzyme [Nocardia mexicana]
MLDGEWLAALTRTAREAGAEGEPEVLSDRADGPVVRVGDVVAKAHASDTDDSALRARLGVAADPLLQDVLLPPLTVGGRLLQHHAGRPITVWQYGIPVDPDDPDAAPWEHAAALLARLHRSAPRAESGSPRLDRSAAAAPSDPGARRFPHPRAGDPGQPLPRATGESRLPVAGAPDRVRRAIARLRAATHAHPAAAAAVLRAHDQLPELENVPKALVHGDFHLGQLVRAPGGASPALPRESDTRPHDLASGTDLRDQLINGENPWRLIDVDDLGIGDPVWDLARPAAFFAVGILEPVAWERFLGAYRRRGGPAVSSQSNEWAALDLPARALVVQHAALAVVKAGAALDDLDTALIDACVRMS